MRRWRSGDLFPTDSPVPPEQMIGRAGDVADLVARLTSRTNVIVPGDRRTGKTSVCEAALRLLKHRGYYTVEVDLMKVLDSQLLTEDVLRQTATNRTRRYQAQADAGSLLRRWRSRLPALLGGTDLEKYSRGLQALIASVNLREALTRIDRAAADDQTDGILFVDEVQQVARFVDSDSVLAEMRAAFDEFQRVTLLFAGSEQHLVDELFVEGGRLNRYAHPFGLTEIGADEWRAGLSRLFALDNCSVDAAALETLVVEGRGEPQRTMFIAQQTHLLACELQTQSIDAQLAADGARRAATSMDRWAI